MCVAVCAKLNIFSIPSVISVRECHFRAGAHRNDVIAQREPIKTHNVLLLCDFCTVYRAILVSPYDWKTIQLSSDKMFGNKLWF